MRKYRFHKAQLKTYKGTKTYPKKFPVDPTLSPERFLEVQFAGWVRNITVLFRNSPGVVIPLVNAVATSMRVDTYQLRALFLKVSDEIANEPAFCAEAFPVLYQSGCSERDICNILRFRSEDKYWRLRKETLSLESVSRAYAPVYTPEDRMLMDRVLVWWLCNCEGWVWRYFESSRQKTCRTRKAERAADSQTQEIEDV